MNKFMLALVFCCFSFDSYINANSIMMQKDTSINNQLRKKEKTVGWMLLFDGNTLNGCALLKMGKAHGKLQTECYAAAAPMQAMQIL
jgi:hypothetical protein